MQYIEKELEEFKKEFDKEILEFLKDKKPKSILKWIIYYIKIGGKRIRPFLAYKTAKELFLKNIDEEKEFKKLLYAIEIYHNSILILDDIQDNDKERRGKKTLWIIIGKEQAINVGFYGLLFSIDIVKSLKIEENKKRKIIEIFDEITKKTVKGQFIDIEMTKIWKKLKKRRLLKIYIKNNVLKTAYYLLLPIEVSFAYFSKELDKKIKKEILIIGFVFQLMNDLEDLKERKSDMRRKLPTLPYILTFYNEKNKEIFEKEPELLIKKYKKKVTRKIRAFLNKVEGKISSKHNKEFFILIRKKIEENLQFIEKTY